MTVAARPLADGSGLAARYGALGLPLAFASLPLYVHVPAFYASVAGMSLTTIGLVLLCIRMMDMVVDPLVGSISDRYQGSRKFIMGASVPLLAIGYFALFSPPAGMDQGTKILWLAGSLIAVYAAYSALTINHYAMGVALANTPHQNTILATWREGAMLIGVLLASLLPPVLTRIIGIGDAYRVLAMVLSVLLLLGALTTLTIREPRSESSGRRAFPFAVLRTLNLRWALAVTFLNAFPIAITSTLFVFFVSDVLQAESHIGAFLAIYFASAVIGMPLWSRLAQTRGKTTSILISIPMAVVVFAFAAFLGPGDIGAFYMVCILSGITLGADTVLLPSLFADQLHDTPGESGAAFGWWHFLNKASLALAAGIALPLLEIAGYAPGPNNSPASLGILAAGYALVPCACKAIAAVVLYIGPLHGQRDKSTSMQPTTVS